MKRALVAIASVGMVSGCATVQGTMDSMTNRAANEVSNSASNAVSSSADQGFTKAEEGTTAYRECAKLGEDHVSLVEERSLGGALAISAALRIAQVRNTPTTDTNAAHLRDFWTLDYPESAALNRMNAAVAKVGTQLAALSSRPELPWTFAVIDDPSINAFSTPGGYVLVSRGLLEQIHTENALAGVLAHEISHVTQRHAIAAYLDAKVSACRSAAVKKIGTGLIQGATGLDLDKAQATFNRLLAAPASVLNFDLPENFDALGLVTDKLTNTLLSKPLPEQQELEADRLGVDLMVKAGYAPEPFENLIVEKLPDPKPGSFLARHPSKQDRKAALDQEIAKIKADPLYDYEKAEATGSVQLAKVIEENVHATSATADAPAP